MLKNKAILITGVGKGIGLDIVKKGINYGAYVYGITRSKQDLKKFAKMRNCKISLGDIKNKNVIQKILDKSIQDKKK